MANQLSPRITGELADLVNQVVKELDLTGFQISASEDGEYLKFQRNFHAATLQTDLIRQGRWPDIRHIFRAAIQPGPQLTNQLAEDTEWKRDWR